MRMSNYLDPDQVGHFGSGSKLFAKFYQQTTNVGTGR